MKLSSLITAAVAAASTAYALGAGNPAIGHVAPRALTTKYVAKYWNTTVTNGVGGVGTGNTGATGTGGLGIVIPSGTGNIGPTGTSIVLPINGTARYKYTGTVGVAPGLNVTTVLSFVTVVPIPNKSVTVVSRTAGVAPTGYVHAYYADPLRHRHLVGVITDKTVIDNTPTAILATEVVRTPGTVNKRNKRETVEEALNASLSAKEKRLSTHRARFMAHTQVFPTSAQPTVQKKLELRRRDADPDTVTEDNLGYIAALNLCLGHMINAGLISEDTTIEELAAFFDDDELEKRQSIIYTSPCKLVGEKFTLAQCIAASVNLPKRAGQKIGACAGCKLGGRDEVNLPKSAIRRIGAGAARELGNPVRLASQDDLTKKEIEVGAGANDMYETHFDRPAEKFPKQGTHGAIVHIGNGTAVNLDDNGIPTGTQPIKANLPLPTLGQPEYRDFWSWKNIREWSEKHFAQRLGPRDQVEDVEVVESTGQPIEVAKREAFYRVIEKDILKGLPKVKLVGDMPMVNTAIWVADDDKLVSTPAVDAIVAVTIWDCGTQNAGNVKRQAPTATVGTKYGNQNLDMVSLEEPTTFRTVKVSLAGGVPNPTVVLSGSFKTLTATTGTQYGNQNPDMIDLPELGIQRTFFRTTDAAEAAAYAKRQTELENQNMIDLEATTLRSGGVVLSGNGPVPTVDLSAGFSSPTATADNLYGYENPNMVDLTELGRERAVSRITDAAEATEAY